MTNKQLKQILKDAYTAGECDTYVEDTLLQSACDFIGQEVTGKVTDEEHDKIINAYRLGFLGTDREVARYKNESISNHRGR
jgi:hypothetical protein